MSLVGVLKRWLVEPPVFDAMVLPCAFAAVTVPTALRFVVDDHISGVAFSPYLPFVLIAALLMDWRYAALVALASAAVADMMFIDPRFVPIAGPTDVFGILVFLGTSALMLTLVRAARYFVRNSPGPVACESKATGIIFSLEDGQAWASWSGCGSRQRLGPEEEVAGMMKDFLAQVEIGRRLNRQPL
ncbi:DUF4118 domain-containing protein [Sphingomonas alba]|uniref:DUF4118 domain-containing protein n=1 Tax=Sphingomonas alba TaxID=2908208 RepID=A0ABT0RLN4_9SPHN|nr:DUF4118 domain-containing protein [Sphingomonas alba]MCL6683552.1 DUF4118 domain-containing protein [Sphingomonas alba]